MNKCKLFTLSIYYYILYLITPKSKLKVLYYATFDCFKDKRNDYALEMCRCIRRGLKKVYNKYRYYIIDDYIPEFNNYNARALFNGKGGFYWWDSDNIKDRYNYFKWLIKIYKNR